MSDDGAGRVGDDRAERRASDGDGDGAHRSLTLHPIGFARTPFPDRASAPRQPRAAEGAVGRIEMIARPGIEHALSDLDAWSHVWLLFWFHLNDGWRPKVLPPRSGGRRRGVFATRSPHRPNPLGISVVRLDGVDRGKLVLHVRDVDLVDGTPIFDVKPYVAYTDAVPDASAGWLVDDPAPAYEVLWSERAEAQLAWLAARGVDLRAPIAQALALGPQPHPYRRIRIEGDGLRLAWKEWRVRFHAPPEARAVHVQSIASGHRASDRARDPSLALHRDYAEAFGDGEP